MKIKYKTQFISEVIKKEIYRDTILEISVENKFIFEKEINDYIYFIIRKKLVEANPEPTEVWNVGDRLRGSVSFNVDGVSYYVTFEREVCTSVIGIDYK